MIGTLRPAPDDVDATHCEAVTYTVLQRLPRQVTPPPGGCEGKRPKCPYRVFCRGVRGRLPCEHGFVVRYGGGQVGEI